MIDIIGNIKLDESKPERIDQLIACITSYTFLGPYNANLYVRINLPSPQLAEQISKWNGGLKSIGRNWKMTIGNDATDYGPAYVDMMKLMENPNPFVLNFMEDQFMMLDNPNTLMHLIGFMKQYKADVCKASFHQVEQNSIGGITPIADVPGLAMVFDNRPANHVAYCSHYQDRYYIGCNFLTTREFALKFWGRPLGPKPHPYEISEWEAAWQHRCVIPHFEIQAAIDDDHGEPNSCLLKRPDAKKFWDMYNLI